MSWKPRSEAAEAHGPGGVGGATVAWNPPPVGVRVTASLQLPADLLTPLEEGISSHVGGEVVVRSASCTGRVFITGGAVAWVTCEAIKTRLTDVLRDRAGLRSSDLAAVLEECKKTGGNFAETLLRWGLLDRDRMRECLVRHNAHHLLGLATLQGSVRAMFVPQARRYSSDFLFTLDELVAAARQIREESEPPPLPEPTVPIPEVPLPGADSITGAALKAAHASLQGCVLVALVDLRTGTPVGCWPATAVEGGASAILLGEATRALLTMGPVVRLAAAGGGGGVNELVIEAEDMVVVARRSTRLTGQGLIAICREPPNLGWALGHARIALGSIEDALTTQTGG